MNIKSKCCSCGLEQHSDSCRPYWWVNDKGWWKCDHCGEAINPKWKRYQKMQPGYHGQDEPLPTPEVPIGNKQWVHRKCYEDIKCQNPTFTQLVPHASGAENLKIICRSIISWIRRKARLRIHVTVR